MYSLLYYLLPTSPQQKIYSFLMIPQLSPALSTKGILCHFIYTRILAFPIASSQAYLPLHARPVSTICRTTSSHDDLAPIDINFLRFPAPVCSQRSCTSHIRANIPVSTGTLAQSISPRLAIYCRFQTLILIGKLKRPQSLG